MRYLLPLLLIAAAGCSKPVEGDPAVSTTTPANSTKPVEEGDGKAPGMTAAPTPGPAAPPASMGMGGSPAAPTGGEIPGAGGTAAVPPAPAGGSVAPSGMGTSNPNSTVPPASAPR